MKFLVVLAIFGFVLLGQENVAQDRPDVEQLKTQLQSANERIAQLEQRIELMAKQQQGVIQFLQAGQALCELDKKATPK